MTQRPLRPCNQYGCPNLTKERYCDTHKYIEQQKESERQKNYDKNIRHKRDKKYADFYRSTAWLTTRDYILSLYNGIDLYAYYVDKELKHANTVHHIIELKDNWNRRLDITNLFPMSNDTHIKIHKLYEKDKKGTQALLLDLLNRWKREHSKG